MVCSIGTAVLVRDGLNPWLAAVAGAVLGAAPEGVNAFLAKHFKLPVIAMSLRGRLPPTAASPRTCPTGRPVGNSFYRWGGATHLGMPTVAASPLLSG
jgi:ribose transport system permease protein